MRLQLKRLSKIERRKHHPLIHKIHKEHGISKKTLFYVKEYGPHSNIPGTIIRESLKILILASIISSFGGLALEEIKPLFISIIPLVIILPALNDMIGDYSMIISSKFTTLLYENRVWNKWWRDSDIQKLFVQIMIIAVITSAAASALAVMIANLSGYVSGMEIVIKIFAISIIDVILLVSILTLVSITAAFHFYRKGEDPNNFLIPITTSIADFGNMIILAMLILAFF